MATDFSGGYTPCRNITSMEWKRESEDFTYESYNRNHEWIFNGGVRVPGSAGPEYHGDPAKVNSEEAFVAALQAAKC